MADLKSILVPVSDEVSARPALDVALLLGRDLKCHVKALHVRTDPTNAVPLVGEGMSGVMVEEMISAAERQAEDRSFKARALFDERRKAFGAELREAPSAAAEFSTAWREVVGREEDYVARCGRLHDLLVVGRPLADRELPSMMTLNAALMESGRPILVAPPEAPSAFGNHVAIAWNGSAEAARAVAAALPFLHRAKTISIVAAREVDADLVLSPAELATYLARHGLAATAHGFTSGVTNVGEVLLDEVTKLGADMLVMGAYTHSRLRQLILGGVTRHMLHHATIPVLMSH